MKNLLFITMSIGLLAISSCAKDPTDINVDFPATGASGINILTLPNPSTVTNVDDYSMTAMCEENAVLRVRLTNLTPNTTPTPTWFYLNNTGWNIGTYHEDHHTQLFTNDGGGLHDLDLTFAGVGGACLVEILENSNKPTSSQVLYW